MTLSCEFSSSDPLPNFDVCSTQWQRHLGCWTADISSLLFSIDPEVNNCHECWSCAMTNLKSQGIASASSSSLLQSYGMWTCKSYFILEVRDRPTHVAGPVSKCSIRHAQILKWLICEKKRRKISTDSYMAIVLIGPVFITWLVHSHYSTPPSLTIIFYFKMNLIIFSFECFLVLSAYSWDLHSCITLYSRLAPITWLLFFFSVNTEFSFPVCARASPKDTLNCVSYFDKYGGMLEKFLPYFFVSHNSSPQHGHPIIWMWTGVGSGSILAKYSVQTTFSVETWKPFKKL